MRQLFQDVKNKRNFVFQKSSTIRGTLSVFNSFLSDFITLEALAASVSARKSSMYQKLTAGIDCVWVVRVYEFSFEVPLISWSPIPRTAISKIFRQHPSRLVYGTRDAYYKNWKIWMEKSSAGCFTFVVCIPLSPAFHSRCVLHPVFSPFLSVSFFLSCVCHFLLLVFLSNSSAPSPPWDRLNVDSFSAGTENGIVCPVSLTTNNTG